MLPPDGRLDGAGRRRAATPCASRSPTPLPASACPTTAPCGTSSSRTVGCRRAAATSTGRPPRRRDYQAILAIAETVYAAGPAAVARAQREPAHRTAAQPTRVRGESTGDPAALRAIGGLHD